MPDLSMTHPCSSAYLERYRVEARKRLRASLVGSHVTRRKGQSLEFREFAAYVPGDDVRHVDWRASARRGAEDDLLVRRFAAEEQMRLVISVDARPTMALPEIMSKVQIAVWLAEAIAWIALRSEDQVILHSLFGRGPSALVGLPKITSRLRIRRILERFLDGKQGDTPNTHALRPYLPPTSVWLILTDSYFSEQAGTVLAQAITEAEEGMRWVLLTDLNSWLCEQEWVGKGAKLITGPGLDPPRPYNMDEGGFQHVAELIDAHKTRFLTMARRSQYDIIWEWPPQTNQDSPEFFKQQFAEDRVLRRLFMREP